MPLFGGRKSSSSNQKDEEKTEENGDIDHHLQIPGFERDGHKIRPKVQPDGESGRRGFNPAKFLKICWRSSCVASQWVNILWPVVPVAMVMHWARPDQHMWIFILSYIAMVPAATLLGFAGQELALKMPKVVGVVIETTLGSLVEIILFMVLLKHYRDDGVAIIQAAILGSLLANLLLCLGACFFVGGLFREEQKFHDAVSDVGSNLMLVAGSKCESLCQSTDSHTNIRNSGSRDSDDLLRCSQ